MSTYLSFKFYIFIISFLLSVNCKMVASLSSSKTLKKILIQSSNSENLSLSSLSSAGDMQDTNDTWKAAEFQLHNFSSVLSEYPVVSRSLPFKNSSRYFFSKGKSASLTVTLKSFRHGILFLNFSYFIGKTVTKESELDVHRPTNETGLEVTSSINSTHITEISGMAKEISAPNIPTKVPELNQSSLSSVSISISSTPETLKIPEPLPIKLSAHGAHRKRRSLLVPELIYDTPHAEEQVVPSVSSEEIGNGKSNEMVTLKSISADGNTSELSTSIIVASNASMTNVIDSLTLKQAVEMIKSAAAVISKSAVGPDTSTTGPMMSVVHASDVTNTTGRTVISSNSKISDKNNDSGSKYHPKATEIELSEFTSRPTTPRLKHKAHSSGESNTKSKRMKETKHKSKNNSNNNSKGEKKRRKNKSKKIDNVERTEKDENSDEDGHKSSSSSSSEEDEEDIEEDEGRKPKISYKMWRASLEKKNRPSGLYVTVNDDIIFDNWDGIWDKHYVLGKWTGSKSKAIFNGKWNQTNLFLNWDDVTASRDVKIIFEWEPLQGDFELILSDIDISTMVSPEDSCTPPPEQVKDVSSNNNNKEKLIQLGKTMTEESKDKFNLSLSTLNGSDNQSSIIVLKQSRDEEGNWKIIKMKNGDESTSGKIKDLDLFELPDNGKVKKNEQAEDILKAILEKWHDKDVSSTTSQVPPLKAFSNTLHIENATLAPSTNHAEVSPAQDKLTLPIEPTTVPTKSTTVVKIIEPEVVVSPSTVKPPLSTLTTSNIPPEFTTVHISTATPPLSKILTSGSATTFTTIITEPTPTIKENTTTTTTTSPSPTTTITSTTKAASSSTSTTTMEPQERMEKIRPPRLAHQRKTDNWTALLVSIFTGAIALTILVMIVKKRIDISIKGKNAVR